MLVEICYSKEWEWYQPAAQYQSPVNFYHILLTDCACVTNILKSSQTHEEWRRLAVSVTCFRAKRFMSTVASRHHKEPSYNKTVCASPLLPSAIHELRRNEDECHCHKFPHYFSKIYPCQLHN